MCYTDHYVEDTAQQVDSVNVGLMQCVTVKNKRKLLHSKFTVLLQLE